nr:MFS transporter [Enterocloster clostridioformis]
MQQLEKLSWRSKLSFGVGAFGKDLVYALVGNLFMFYLTDVRFVAPAFVGTLFMVARIWDAFRPLYGHGGGQYPEQMGQIPPLDHDRHCT